MADDYRANLRNQRRSNRSFLSSRSSSAQGNTARDRANNLERLESATSARQLTSPTMGPTSMLGSRPPPIASRAEASAESNEREGASGLKSPAQSLVATNQPADSFLAERRERRIIRERGDITPSPSSAKSDRPQNCESSLGLAEESETGHSSCSSSTPNSRSQSLKPKPSLRRQDSSAQLRPASESAIEACMHRKPSPSQQDSPRPSGLPISSANPRHKPGSGQRGSFKATTSIPRPAPTLSSGQLSPSQRDHSALPRPHTSFASSRQSPGHNSSHRSGLRQRDNSASLEVPPLMATKPSEPNFIPDPASSQSHLKSSELSARSIPEPSTRWEPTSEQDNSGVTKPSAYEVNQSQKSSSDESDSRISANSAQPVSESTLGQNSSPSREDALKVGTPQLVPDYSPQPSSKSEPGLSQGRPEASHSLTPSNSKSVASPEESDSFSLFASSSDSAASSESRSQSDAGERDSCSESSTSSAPLGADTDSSSYATSTCNVGQEETEIPSATQPETKSDSTSDPDRSKLSGAGIEADSSPTIPISESRQEENQFSAHVMTSCEPNDPSTSSLAEGAVEGTNETPTATERPLSDAIVWEPSNAQPFPVTRKGEIPGLDYPSPGKASVLIFRDTHEKEPSTPSFLVTEIIEYYDNQCSELQRIIFKLAAELSAAAHPMNGDVKATPDTAIYLNKGKSENEKQQSEKEREADWIPKMSGKTQGKAKMPEVKQEKNETSHNVKLTAVGHGKPSRPYPLRLRIPAKNTEGSFASTSASESRRIQTMIEANRCLSRVERLSHKKGQTPKFTRAVYEAMNLTRALGDANLLSKALAWKGIAFYKLNKRDSALMTLSEAIDMATKLDDGDDLREWEKMREDWKDEVEQGQARG